MEPVPLVFNANFAPFLADRDFIMFDQRGTGLSEPALDCPEFVEVTFDTLDEDLTVDERVALNTKPESTEGRPWGQPLKKPAGAPLNLG